MNEANWQPQLSIIISTLDRYDDLERCLDALRPDSQQGWGQYEIIVIDQTPTANRKPVGFDNHILRHVFQDVTGLSIGRNLGVSLSRSDIIAFIDDDAIPCPDWALSIINIFKTDTLNRVLCCGGKVIPQWPTSGRPVWMNRMLEGYLSCIDWGEETRPLRQGEWIVGANMAFRRVVFERFGLFSEGLGRNGTSSLLSNEETELLKRIGLDSVLYSHLPLVRHVIPHARTQIEWFRRRAYWQAVSDLLSGSAWLSPVEARQWLGEYIASSAAEYRSLNALYLRPTDPRQAELQVRACYALTILGAAGFSSPEQ